MLSRRERDELRMNVRLVYSSYIQIDVALSRVLLIQTEFMLRW